MEDINMKTLPVAVQLFSVRDALDADFEGTLRKIKEMGYDGVEFAGLHGHDPLEVRALCEEIGLVPMSAHVPFYDMLADPDGVFASYQKIGMKYMVIPYLEPDCRSDTPRWAQTMVDVRNLSELAKKYGFVMLYHNHDFEFKKLGDTYVLDYMYDTIPADLLQTEIDTCWTNVGGEVPAAYVRKYTGRAPVVHLKDFVMPGKKPENMYELIGIKPEGEAAPEEAFAFRPIGYGVQDIPAILEAAVDAGAEWVVVEQDRPSMGKTPMESIAMSREFLKKLGW